MLLLEGLPESTENAQIITATSFGVFYWLQFSYCFDLLAVVLFRLATPMWHELTLAAKRSEQSVSGAEATVGLTLTNMSVLQLPPTQHIHRFWFTERVLQEISQLGIAEGDVFALGCQGGNDISQGGQTLIDGLRLLQPISDAARN